jgi:hypothetical protein
MSEMPHCAIRNADATSCGCVNFCYDKWRESNQILMTLAVEVMESKWRHPGSSEIAGRYGETALKMQEKTARCTVGEGLCIQ